MDEDIFNMEVRRFLKQLGVTSQREIEKAVRAAIADGRLTPADRVQVKATITSDAVALDHVVTAELALR